ncbi:hypothetical protein BN1708_018530, partial [Verticillium longisporum]
RRPDAARVAALGLPPRPHRRGRDDAGPPLGRRP